MSRMIPVTEAMIAYVGRWGAREHPVLRRCREETAKMPMANMQIAPEQGAFLAFLAKAIGAKRTLEIGTFTGYSALSVALALPPDGRVMALDVSREFTDKARGYWKEAGMESKIELRPRPGVESPPPTARGRPPPL